MGVGNWSEDVVLVDLPPEPRIPIECQHAVPLILLNLASCAVFARDSQSFGRTKRIDTTKTQVEELNQLCFAEKSSAEQQSENGRANTVMKFSGGTALQRQFAQYAFFLVAGAGQHIHSVLEDIKNRLQRFFYCLWAARQIYNQCAAANSRYTA